MYFEESDFCLRANKINKNYQINNIKINHNAGSSVIIKNDKEKEEIEKLRNWHFIWSKYFYYKKNYGTIFSIFFFMPVLFRIIFRISLYSMTGNVKKKEKYLIRLDGLYTSMLGKKSNKRIGS